MCSEEEYVYKLFFTPDTIKYQCACCFQNGTEMGTLLRNEVTSFNILTRERTFLTSFPGPSRYSKWYRENSANYPQPEMIPNLDRKWSQDRKWSPEWTANEPAINEERRGRCTPFSFFIFNIFPRTESVHARHFYPVTWLLLTKLIEKTLCTAGSANDPGTANVPRPEIIPKLDRKWSQDRKWSPEWTANAPAKTRNGVDGASHFCFHFQYLCTLDIFYLVTWYW